MWRSLSLRLRHFFFGCSTEIRVKVNTCDEIEKHVAWVEIVHSHPGDQEMMIYVPCQKWSWNETRRKKWQSVLTILKLEFCHDDSPGLLTFFREMVAIIGFVPNLWKFLDLIDKQVFVEELGLQIGHRVDFDTRHDELKAITQDFKWKFEKLQMANGCEVRNTGM